MKVIVIGDTHSRGERAFADELTTWVKAHHLNGIALIAPNDPVRADAIVLTPSGPVVVEVKTLSEDVEGPLSVPVNDEWSDAQARLNLLTHGQINPVGQVSRYATGLRNHLKAATELPSTDVTGLIVLVQPNTKVQVSINADGGIMHYPRKTLGVDVTTLTRYGGNGPLRRYFRGRSATSHAWSRAEAIEFLEALGLGRSSSQFPTEDEFTQEGFLSEPARPERAARVEDTAEETATLTVTSRITSEGSTRAVAQSSAPVDDTQRMAFPDVTPADPTEATGVIPLHTVSDEPPVATTDGAPGIHREHTQAVPQQAATTPWKATPKIAHSEPLLPQGSSGWRAGSTGSGAAPAPEQVPPHQTRGTSPWYSPRGYEPSVTAQRIPGHGRVARRGGPGRLAKAVAVPVALVLALGVLVWGARALSSTFGAPGESETLISTKTGNILCRMTSTQTRCDINTVQYSMPSVPAKCSGSSNWGHTFLIAGGEKARLECPRERMLVTEQTTEQLDWGESKTVGQTTCRSTPQYLTCTSGNHGFRLRKAKYEVW